MQKQRPNQLGSHEGTQRMRRKREGKSKNQKKSERGEEKSWPARRRSRTKEEICRIIARERDIGCECAVHVGRERERDGGEEIYS